MFKEFFKLNRLLALTAVIWAGYSCSMAFQEFDNIDNCLDFGGKWHENLSICEMSNDKRKMLL